MATDTGLSVGGFIGIVIALAILNVVGVIGYNKFDIDVSVKLDSDRVPKLRYGLLGLVLLSWIFSIACTVACTFVKIKYSSGSIAGYGYSEAYFLGFHGAEIQGQCARGDIEDDRVQTAYAFAILNTLLTSTVLIGCPLVIFNVIKDANTANKVWKIMGFLMLASTWFCLFTFYIQQTVSCFGMHNFMDVDCSLGGAGVAQVFNSIFLIGICVLFFILPSPTAEGDGNGENGDANQTKENNEKDGDDPVVEQPSA